MKKKISDEEWNGNIEQIGLMIIGLSIAIVFISLTVQGLVEGAEKDRINFEEKYKPICEKYNKLWLESGNTYYGRCYDNYGGVLIEYTIIEKGEEFYLKKK